MPIIMTKDVIKTLIAEYQQFVRSVPLTPRDVEFADGQNYVFVGLRHAGKSYLMYQRIGELLRAGRDINDILYFNFEDDRIDSLSLPDLDLIKTCYEEMYSQRPVFFLDEVQLVEHWEKFARRLADQRYEVYITGSNARMLSQEIATTLGGRYMVQTVFPFSFREYLLAGGIDLSARNALYTHRKAVVALADTYFRRGGLPETVGMANVRQWLSGLYSKIFYGDIVARHAIRNGYALRVLVRKLAESVKQPLSYSRMAAIVSAAGKRLTTDTVIDYIDYMIESWMLLPFENLHVKLQDKAANRKYYFIDNGLLALFLIDANTSLLENIVAVTLRRRYGEESYFWNDGSTEVDFCVPEAGLAVQVAYSLLDPDTERRETAALLAYASYQDARQLMIVTKDEERVIEREGREIAVVPLWRWLVGEDSC